MSVRCLILQGGKKMDEQLKISVSKQIITKKGEIITVTIETVNTSPKKKIVQEFVKVMLSELFSAL